MDYSNFTKTQLLAVIDELEMLNKELLAQKEQEARLDFACSGNLAHVFGDQVLRVTANIIAGNIWVQDTVGRYGGEEFLVLFPNTDQDSASLVCERIRARVAAFVFDEGLKITISGGLAVYQGDTVTAFIDRADKKLYQAKASGRNRIVV